MSPIRRRRTRDEVLSRIRKLFQLDVGTLECSDPSNNNCVSKNVHTQNGYVLLETEAPSKKNYVTQGTFAPMVETNQENNVDKQNERNKLRKLNWELVSSKFEISLEDAAKELKIGTTSLKHWCRDNDIPRWPTRKFTSIRALMKLVMDRPGSIGLEKRDVEAVIKRLEEEIQLLKIMPKREISPEIKSMVINKHGLKKINWIIKEKILKSAKF